MNEPVTPKRNVIHLDLGTGGGELLAECDEIVEFIRSDPEWQRYRKNVGRGTALRYALGVTVKHIRALRAQKQLGAAGG